MKGISEIVAVILMLMVTLAIASSAYVLIFGIFNQKTRTLSLIDASCAGTNGIVVIRNEGQDTIRSSEQNLISVDEACTEPTLVDITSGTNTVYTFTGCGTAKTHNYRLLGPSNGVPISFRCA